MAVENGDCEMRNKWQREQSSDESSGTPIIILSYVFSTWSKGNPGRMMNFTLPTSQRLECGE